MRNKLIIIVIFLVSVVCRINAVNLDLDASTVPNSQSISQLVVPDSIDLDCRIDVSYNFEGRSPSSILNGQLILTDSVSLYKARTKENRYIDEYIITTLNKPTANFFKVLLYDLYTSHNSVIKDKYINERHGICASSSECHIKLSINGKSINETINIYDYIFSFDDPFNIQFEQILELIYAITNKIEQDILRLKHVNWEVEEWILKTFNDEYYEPYNNINSNKYQ